MGLLELVVVSIWIMLPAYIPNNVAVLAGGGSPIDGGRRFRNRRLIGDGKTWRGTGAGIVAGAAVAVVLNGLQDIVTSASGFVVPAFPLGAVLALPVGAMLGDIIASFVKRRTGRERGDSFPLVDQLDFVVVALLTTAIVVPEWFFATFTWSIVAVILILTPALHLITNVLAYLFGFKHEPW